MRQRHIIRIILNSRLSRRNFYKRLLDKSSRLDIIRLSGNEPQTSTTKMDNKSQSESDKKKLTVNDILLDKCIAAGFNLMLHGRHGVGKTHMVLEAFRRNGLKYKYFSASTMDPWIDFIGVPREMEDEHGAYLQLIRPKEFRDDQVEAIFLDEYNRAAKKIRNAVMELIQFKSINGHEFPNLKVVWTAVNPDDGSYDTEGMDDAQKDRFQVHIEVPFKPDPKFFADKYGPDTAEAAIAWWKSLPAETQAKVSPRRLEYALDAFYLGIELRGLVLPKTANVQKLVEDLSKGPAERKFQQLLASKKRRPMKEFLQDENHFSDCEKIIAASSDAIQFCLPLLEVEKQQAMMVKYTKINEFVFANPGYFMDLIQRISDFGQNKEMKDKAKGLLEAQQRRQATLGSATDPFAADKKTVSKYNMNALDNSIKFADNFDGKNVQRGASRNICEITPEAVRAAQTTQQRMPIITDDLMTMVGVGMGMGDAIYGMQVLDYIASRSQETTLTRTSGIDTLINTLVMAIQTGNSEIKISDLAEMAPFVMTKLVPPLVHKAKPGTFIFANK